MGIHSTSDVFLMKILPASHDFLMKLHSASDCPVARIREQSGYALLEYARIREQSGYALEYASRVAMRAPPHCMRTLFL